MACICAHVKIHIFQSLLFKIKTGLVLNPILKNNKLIFKYKYLRGVLMVLKRKKDKVKFKVMGNLNQVNLLSF